MKDNISSAQWSAILGASVSAVLMMNYINLFVTAVGRGAYVSASLLALLTFVALFIVIFLIKNNRFRTPLETTALLLGKKAAIFLCTLTALGFFLFTTEVLNIYVYIVKFYFLPKTPTLFLTVVLFLPAAYIAYCGLRTFGDTASATLIAFCLFLLVFPFTKNNYFPANLMPWDEFLWKDIFSSLPFLFLSAPVITASFFLLPHCSDRRKLYKKATVFTLIFGGLMLFLYLAGMAYFGETIIKKSELPFYNLSPFFKGNLLERFDIFFMLALLPCISIFVTFGFSVFTLISKETAPKIFVKHPKGSMLFLSFTAVICSALTVNRLPLWSIYRYCNVAALLLFCVFALIYLGAYYKERRKENCT